MWVVKLGGSLLGTPELQQWLAVLAEHSDGRIVVVPGGGVFADAVRDHQQLGCYDDAAAHQMALLAMEQYALVMKSMQPAFSLAYSELEIAERSWQHRPIVWMPSRMALADEAIPMCWDVTSDSLAAWLAMKIAADRLVLVKHEAIAEQPLPIRRLVGEGLLDTAFERFSTALTCPIEIVGKSDYQAFIKALAGGPLPTRAF